ncbi:hypothetical protein pb186bvf_014410 [Paramecium bursaria]
MKLNKIKQNQLLIPKNSWKQNSKKFLRKILFILNFQTKL